MGKKDIKTMIKSVRFESVICLSTILLMYILVYVLDFEILTGVIIQIAINFMGLLIFLLVEFIRENRKNKYRKWVATIYREEKPKKLKATDKKIYNYWYNCTERLERVKSKEIKLEIEQAMARHIVKKGVKP